MTTASPLDVPCHHCDTPPARPCTTPSFAQRTPHARRLRAAALAAEHPVQYRDGIPASVPLALSGVHDRAGHRTVTVLCPLCWSRHYHGWDTDEDTNWTHRAEHCAPRLIADARGYWIPPTASLPRT